MMRNMRRSKRVWIVVLVVLSLSSAACNLLEMVGQAPTEQPVLPPTVATNTPPLPTITPLPTSTPVLLPPTAIPTAIPAFTATPSPTRIRFDSGATSASLINQPVGAGTAQQYVINAMAGQTLILTLTPAAPETLPNFTLAVYSAAGSLLGRTSPGAATWAGTLPATGDYRIIVQNMGIATVFALDVTVPRTIAFPSGETAAALNGSVSVPRVDSYLLEGSAGQPLIVDIATPGGNAWLAIRGLDGAYLLRSDQRQVSWAGDLPATQGYLIQVGAGAGSAEYTLRVTAPRRVQFPTGATSVRLEGTLSGQYEGTYVLNAAAGQLMTVSLSAPESGNNAWLAIEGEDGRALLQLTEMKTTWTGTLPASQNYYLTVITDGSPARYSLMVEIARRIQFAPGSTAVRLDGTITQPDGVSYVLEARAGQTMSVNVAPAAEVYFNIVGQDGIPLARYQGSWTGTLPATQDYTIRVAAAGGATGVGYVLEVSVTG